MPWHDILTAGVDTWSDYDDTDDERCAVDFARDVGGSTIDDRATSALVNTASEEDLRAKRACASDRSSGEDAREGAEGEKTTRRGEREDAREGARRANDPTEATKGHGEGDGAEGAKTGASREDWGTKLGLDAGWRSERRDLEWQCLWIELRVREIGRHIERYESRLETMKARGETSGRDAKEEESEDFKNDGTRGDLPRKRLRRGKATPRAPVILGHPMFAALENSGSKGGRAAKKKTMPAPQEPSTTTTAELSGSKALGSGKRKSSEDNPKSSEEKKRKVMEAIVPKETNSDSDISTTALYEQIDAAQKRVASLKQRLSQTAPKLSQKNSESKFKTPASKSRGDKHAAEKTPGSSGKRGTSRKAEAYDINNVISAQGPAKYVERAIHETIATPKVRAASTYVSPAQIATDGESSDEDVSDAVYIERHAKLEVDERAARTPLARGRSAQKQPPTPSGKQVSLFDVDVDDASPNSTAEAATTTLTNSK
jgi:hypothetical protein